MIFNLFKAKPTLKEFVSEGFVDIHSHILPGIDDGAKNIQDSIKLISEMKKLGFSKIIATPHTYPGLYDNTNYSIENSFSKISKKIDSDIEVSFASEYMLDFSLIEKAMDKTLLCIKENYVLIEMSYISKPINLYDIIFKLKNYGYNPILAHPERYRFLFNDFNEFYKLKNIGCFFQINLLSITGYYGNDILNICEKLIKDKLVDFSGSDIHNLKHIKSFDNKIKINNLKGIESIIDKNSFFK